MYSKALIIVDFENEWINRRSDYFVGDISGEIARTNALIDHCRGNGYKIIFTTHVEKGSSTAFAGGTDRVRMIKGIHKLGSDILVTKNKISPFYKTSLEKELRGIKSIVACGILTNLCVRSLAQDAYDRDFNITVIKDCCVAFDKKTQDFTFKDLKATREEIGFLNVKQFIDRVH
jgi:nicotinamidase-related amidase